MGVNFHLTFIIVATIEPIPSPDGSEIVCGKYG